MDKKAQLVKFTAKSLLLLFALLFLIAFSVNKEEPESQLQTSSLSKESAKNVPHEQIPKKMRRTQ